MVAKLCYEEIFQNLKSFMVIFIDKKINFVCT